MTAKEYLEQYHDPKLEKYICLLSLAMSSSKSIVEFQGKGGCDKRLERLVERIDELYDNEIYKIYQRRLDIERTIRQVEDETLQKLLWHRYVRGLSWDEVAKVLNKSTRYVLCNLHPKALRIISTKILDR